MGDHTNIAPKGRGSVGKQEDRAAWLSRRDMLKAGGAIALGLTGVAATLIEVLELASARPPHHSTLP